MPLSKDNIVSIAIWVLPVLVGPRTAVILYLVISIFSILFFNLPDVVGAKEQK